MNDMNNEPYNMPLNRLRKYKVLVRCMMLLDELQVTHAHVFKEDPMINGYLENMEEDLKWLMESDSD